ncbi:13447_t:CDS:2 [Entrophospora sp. SA101]|nr:13447_t:CDS:2 [Entrophospora sp. SA101]
MEIIDRAIICGLIISVPLLVTSASRLIPFFQNKGLIDDDIWPEFMMTAIPFITFITFGTTSAIRRQLPTSSPKTPSSVLTKTPNSITFPSSFNNHDYNYDSNNNYNNYNDHNNDNNPSTMVTSTFSNRVNATTDPFINRRKQPPLQLNIHQNNRSGGSSSSNNNNISRVDSISKRIDKNAISKRDYDHSSLLARAMSGKSILKLIDDVDDDELKERNEKLRALLRIDDGDNNDDDDNNSTTFKIVDNSRQSSPEAIIQIPTINITKVPNINHEDNGNQEIILGIPSNKSKLVYSSLMAPPPHLIATELVAEIAATEPVSEPPVIVANDIIHNTLINIHFIVMMITEIVLDQPPLLLAIMVVEIICRQRLLLDLLKESNPVLEFKLTLMILTTNFHRHQHL